MTDVIQQQIEQIEHQVQIAEAGYAAFRRMYAQTNRPPQKKPYTSRLGLVRTALITIMVASSIVSASHTIPTFAGKLGLDNIVEAFFGLCVGIAAFFMSEIALATFAYVGVIRHYRESQQEPKSLKRLVFMGVCVPFLVMAAANINHEFTLNGMSLPAEITTLITLAISLSAPFMGYISGEVFAMYEVIDRVDEEKHETVQAALQDTWEDKCRQAWGRSKGSYGGNIKIEPVPMPSIPFSNGNSIGMIGMENVGSIQILPSKSSIGHMKKPQASQMTREYFEGHEDELIASNASGAIAAGVAGHSTVYKVMAQMREERGIQG